MPETSRVLFPLLQLAPEARAVERLPRNSPGPGEAPGSGRRGPEIRGTGERAEGARPGRSGTTRRGLAALGAGSSAPSPQLGLAVRRGGKGVPAERGWTRPPREDVGDSGCPPGSPAAGEGRQGEEPERRPRPGGRAVC